MLCPDQRSAAGRIKTHRLQPIEHNDDFAPTALLFTAARTGRQGVESSRSTGKMANEEAAKLDQFLQWLQIFDDIVPDSGAPAYKLFMEAVGVACIVFYLYASFMIS
ncbi:hypothetical protein QQ045_011656 [Rhodiola kirilowii]